MTMANSGVKPAINEAEIVDYYDNCQIDYELVWHLKSMLSMHYGYWDENTTRLRHALINMNNQLAGFGHIAHGSYVLDAGCGVGGSSFYLAKHLNCTTSGITLSEKQVTTCRQNAEAAGLSRQCTFSKQNYLHTEFADNSFDVVWAIESVCYAWDKQDFLNEAFRVLKPGGTVVVADFFTNPFDPETREAEIMEKWTDTWAIKAYAGIDEFWEKMAVAGFTQRRKKDVTPNVRRSIMRLYYSFFPGLVITNVSQFLGFRKKIQTANTWSTYYQYLAYKKDLWRYYFFTATKPK